MAGIVFLKTNNLDRIKEFYMDIIGVTVWINQKDCIIFKHDNFLLGFCERKGELGTGWLLTFFYQTTTEVDEIYVKMKDYAVTKPVRNDDYHIYQFFAKDPEGRNLEFQCFLHEIDFRWKYYHH